MSQDNLVQPAPRVLRALVLQAWRDPRAQQDQRVCRVSLVFQVVKAQRAIRVKRVQRGLDLQVQPGLPVSRVILARQVSRVILEKRVYRVRPALRVIQALDLQGLPVL